LAKFGERGSTVMLGADHSWCGHIPARHMGTPRVAESKQRTRGQLSLDGNSLSSQEQVAFKVKLPSSGKLAPHAQEIWRRRRIGPQTANRSLASIGADVKPTDGQAKRPEQWGCSW